MRLLLINNNPAVSRLLRLSVDKAGYEMDEFEDYGLVPLKSYDVVMVDNELYDEDELGALKEQIHCDYILYICQRGALKPDFVNVSLEKPFLPTDFLALLDKIKNVINSFKVDASSDDNDEKIEDEDMLDEMNLPVNDIDTEETALNLDFETEVDAIEEDEKLNDDITDDMFEDSKEDENLEDTLPIFDLNGVEDNLDLPFGEELDTDNLSEDKMDEFAFDDEDEKELLEEEQEEIVEQEAEKVQEEEIEEEQVEEIENFEEISPAILDKDDINEVKQLLEEDDEETSEDDLLLSSDTDELDALTENESDTFSFDEEEQEEDALVLEDDSSDEIMVPEIPEEISLDTQEDIIEDFSDEIEEIIEKEGEEDTFANVDVTAEKDEDSSIESLDDLNENLLKKAFGEDVEEESTPAENAQDIEVIREEIETSIARSISGLAKNDILREALKGMKINISITFDEKS